MDISILILDGVIKGLLHCLKVGNYINPVKYVAHNWLERNSQ